MSHPGGRAHPRSRSDLRPGHPDLAAGRPSGRALRHLVLLPARRDRAVRARSRGADRVRLRPAVRAAGHRPLSGSARRRARRAGRARHPRGARQRRWPTCSTGAACPRSRHRVAGPRSPSPGVSRASTGTAASPVPRCSPGCPSRRWRCSRWRSPPAATPIPAMSARRSQTIGSALTAAAALLREADGVRPAIDLVYRAIVRAATELPDPA